MIKFKTIIWKTGDSYVITIPKDFVNYGAIKEETEYEVKLKEV